MAKASYVWTGSEWLAIASAFPTATQRFVKSTASTSYTLSLDDTGKELLFTNSNPITLTIPNDTSYTFVVGQTFVIVPTSTGQITFTPDVGVTLNSKSGNKKSNGQYSESRLIKVDANSWLLTGDITS